MGHLNHKLSLNIKHRLWISGFGAIVLMFLSGITFYFWHESAPYIPLIFVLSGALPIGFIVEELRRLPKIKKAQQPHYPPKRSSHQ